MHQRSLSGFEEIEFNQRKGEKTRRGKEKLLPFLSHKVRARATLISNLLLLTSSTVKWRKQHIKRDE
jgi:hypothetical protein